MNDRPVLRLRARAGFSLLEIIVAVSILAILAGVAVPVASSLFNSKARVATTEELENLADATSAFFRDTTTLPAAPGDLMVDPGTSGWSGPYVLLDVFDPVRGIPTSELDAWRNPIQFQTTGTSTMRLTSAGQDGSQGTSDDISLDVDVTPIRRAMTLDRLERLNQAILLYNADHLPGAPLSTTYASLLTTLVATGYLPTATGYDADAWGDAFVVDPPGANPVVRVASSNLPGY